MEVEVVKDDKNDMEVKVSNLTVVEILRVYLNDIGIQFAAWRREHPSKPAIIKIQSSSGTVKKAVADAVVAIGKDLDEIEKGLKK
jgi:DNA-directed RNA polymerase subunit L